MYTDRQGNIYYIYGHVYNHEHISMVYIRCSQAEFSGYLVRKSEKGKINAQYILSDCVDPMK